MKRVGRRADALVSGGKSVERVRDALVSSAAPRTVISSRLADRVARPLGPPWRCTGSPSIPKVCGPTARVDVVVNGCPGGDDQSGGGAVTARDGPRDRPRRDREEREVDQFRDETSDLSASREIVQSQASLKVSVRSWKRYSRGSDLGIWCVEGRDTSHVGLREHEGIAGE
jgi:hypothetical protein